MDRKDIFIKKAKQINSRGNINYDRVIYINNRTPVELFDNDLRSDGTPYGIFWQTPSNHLKGQQHPDKRKERISSSKRLTQDEVIRRFMKKHKDENLDYSQVVYRGMHKKVKIISHDKRPDGSEYGVFWQEPVVHLKGCSHPDIARDKNSERQRYTTDVFVKLAKQIHPKYDYSKVIYTSSQEKVTIICNQQTSKGITHGEFSINPDALLQGKGCPKCGNHLSSGENELFEFISNFGFKVVKGDKTILDGKELDIYVPEVNLGIEFNGLRWHSELFNKDKNYHLNKTILAKEKGVSLVHIFEDEWLLHKELVLKKIEHFLHMTNCVKIGARKCDVRKITKLEAENFLNLTHLQGFTAGTLYYGAFYEDMIVGAMIFKKETSKSSCWNLVRFSTDQRYLIPGLASKILTKFKKENEWVEIKTFLDRRWCFNEMRNVYTTMGFVFDGYVKPDYRYTLGHGERLHKFGFRKNILHKKYGFPLTMTESEMTKSIGYYKIWDCGLIRYKMKKEREG